MVNYIQSHRQPTYKGEIPKTPIDNPKQNMNKDLNHVQFLGPQVSFMLHARRIQLHAKEGIHN